MSLVALPDDALRHIAQYVGLPGCLSMVHACRTLRMVFDPTVLVRQCREHGRVFRKGLAALETSISTFDKVFAMNRANSLNMHDRCCAALWSTVVNFVLHFSGIGLSRCCMHSHNLVAESMKQIADVMPDRNEIQHVMFGLTPRPSPFLEATLALCWLALSKLQMSTENLVLVKCMRYWSDSANARTRNRMFELEYHKTVDRAAAVYRILVKYRDNVSTQRVPAECFR